MTFSIRVHEIFKKIKFFQIKQFQCNIALTAKGEKHEKIKKNIYFSDTPQIVSRKLMFENVSIKRKLLKSRETLPDFTFSPL